MKKVISIFIITILIITSTFAEIKLGIEGNLNFSPIEKQQDYTRLCPGFDAYISTSLFDNFELGLEGQFIKGKKYSSSHSPMDEYQFTSGDLKLGYKFELGNGSSISPSLLCGIAIFKVDFYSGQYHDGEFFYSGIDFAYRYTFDYGMFLTANVRWINSSLYAPIAAGCGFGWAF